MRNRLLLTTGLFSFAIFALWWSGWQPGFIDQGAVARLSRLRGFELTTDDPALYTAALWLISLGGRSAALATLLQGAAWAGIAALWAGRLVELGARRWAAGVTVSAVALLPAMAVGWLALWPESLLGLVSVWALLELVAARRRPLRLGIALGALAAMGMVGLIAALAVLVVVVFGDHAPPRRLLRPMLAATAVVGLIGWLVLPLAMESGRAATSSLAPIIASAVVHHADDLPDADRDVVARVAAFGLWRQLYECSDPTTLIADPEFDEEAVSTGRFRSIGLRAALRHPFTAGGQRLCATYALMEPALPSSTRYYLPAYAVSPNRIGIERTPLWTTAFDATKAVLVRTQAPDRLLWWWRPALPVGAAAVAYGLLAAKKRRSAAGASLLVGLLAGTFIAGPTPEFSTALPLYAVGWMSVTLVTTLRS